MESEKYLEGQSMQRPPLFESDGFIYWKNRFETYVKSKDLDLWHVITDGDFPPIQNNPETKKDEIVPFHKQNDDLKKKLAKNNEAKMVYEEIIKKDSEIVKSKREQRRSIALKARKESSNDNSSTSDSEDEEYVDDSKCFKCGDPNHLVGECPPKQSNIKTKKAFVGGSSSDNDEDEDEKTNDEKCLMAKASIGDKMPKATTTDISLTKSYIPKVSKIPGISPTIAQFYKPIENRNIHEGRVVDQAYYKSNNIERLFTNIRFNYLFKSYESDCTSFRNDDDDNVQTSRASTLSPTTYLNSLNPLEYQNYQMPFAFEQTDETLFERQTTLLNQMQQMHKEMRGWFKSFGKELKGVFSKKKK
ncbi:zf-CCHC domain-containing protein [Tanacetum coccineum]